MSRSLLGLDRDNFLILVSMLLWGPGEGLWFYVQPLYVKSLGANSLEIGFVLSLAPVLMVLILVPAGILADRYGRKRIIVGGSVMGTVAALLLAASRDWRQSIVGLALYWGSTACLPAVHAYVAHASDRKDLNRNFSLMYAAFAVGLIVFPTVGGFLAEQAGFPMVFLVAAIFFAISTLAVVAIREQPQCFCLPGAVPGPAGRPLLFGRGGRTRVGVDRLFGFSPRLGGHRARYRAREILRRYMGTGRRAGHGAHLPGGTAQLRDHSAPGVILLPARGL